MKKTWNTPQLVLLARAKPEEAVLLACKAAPDGRLEVPSDLTPNDMNGGCYSTLTGPAPTALCVQCRDLGTS